MPICLLITLVQEGSRKHNNGYQRRKVPYESEQVEIHDPKLVDSGPVFQAFVLEKVDDGNDVAETPDCHAHHEPYFGRDHKGLSSL